MQKNWQKPDLETLDLNMTMAGSPNEQWDASLFDHSPEILGPKDHS
ncbi:paeninodin family lasso peptide [Paenibacillus pectinilyticus]|nr:paeninodin family lasso peptide [Paenibacillus pectinilyticus]